MKTFFKNEEVELEDLGGGLTRKIMGYDDNLMLVKVFFEKDAVGSPHKHHHEQVTYVLEGKFRVEIAGNEQVLTEGDSFVVPKHAMHGAVCLEKGILIDTFSPKRDEFLE